MQRAQFEEIVEKKVIAQIRELLIVKGAEYASDADRLENFKRQAVKQGQTVLEVWKQFYAKHADSIDTYFSRVKKEAIREALDVVAASRRSAHEPRDVEAFLAALNNVLPVAMKTVDNQLSEPIEGRLLDIIVYCTICVALLEEVRAGTPEQQ